MDINGDGIKDIFSGSYSRQEQPMAGLFQVLYGRKDGSFAEPAPLNGTDDKPLVIPAKPGRDTQKAICTRPTAADWDGDGDLDLIVGNFQGSLFRFEGEGNGKFKPEAHEMQSEGGALQISGAHSDPFVVDWDSDGDLDILSGSSEGGVQWSENLAAKDESPKMTPFRSLIPSKSAGQTNYDPTVFKRLTPEELDSPSTSTRIWVADINGDEKLDIIVGDGTNLLTENKNLTKEEFEKKFKEWAEAFGATMAEMKALPSYQAPGADEIRRKMQTQWQARDELITGEMTGFVWAYLQK